MGENLSIDGLCEQNVCIGDIHQFSNAILQVSEPRKPCVKLLKFTIIQILHMKFLKRA